jgi:menaquinol-cytochrome c reductase iron-sulfur subunit
MPAMVDPSRRSLLKWCTHTLGALVAAILGVPAIAYLVDARNRAAPASDFRPVGGIRVSDVKEINRPAQGVIRDVRQDAWTLHPNDVIGRVWIVRTKPGQDATAFQVFTTECPHLGCAINVSADGATCFKCPCHGAEFSCGGDRIERAGYTNPAPRDMDLLEFELARDPENTDPNNRDLFMVRFQKFYQTRATKDVRA